MNKPEISIIIPIYKAEKYLKRCIESILKQTFADWELILIDDGSPDNSGILCDEYANKDLRIRVFHKTNGGVASAREMGMQHAKGNYSIHVDPDDWIEPNMLEILYQKAITQKADIVICDFMLEYGTHSEVNNQSPKSLKASLCLRQFINMELHGSLCNKLIRTLFYKKYDLHFPKNMNCWEDLYICCCIMMHNPQITYVPLALYHYDFCTNDNSLVRKTNLQGLQAQITCIQLLQKQIQPDLIKELNEMKGLVLLTAFRLKLLEESQIRAIYPEINEWYINKYRKNWHNTNYYGLSLVLSGKSFKKAQLYMKWAYLLSRIKNKIVKI